MHRDHKGRHSPATSRIAKMMRGNTSPKERGGPARKPGNPGREWRMAARKRRLARWKLFANASRRMGEKEWEDVEKSGGYRKALPKTLKRMYKHHPQWARKG